VTPDDVRTVIPELARIYDEPFADSSQIPTILISRLARQDVTVSLSGDGGDELFAGYTRYDAAAATWRSIGWMPYPVRTVLGAALGGASGLFTTIADPMFGRVYDRFGVTGNRGNELRRAATVLRKRSREDLYRHMMSHWKDPAALVQGVATEPTTLLSDPPVWLTDQNFRDYMMLADASTYLPDDILTKVDRASMSCSLEARVPILDHRVVEFALRLPTGYKRDGGRPKAPLKDVLARYLPADLINRPKMGFAMPINDWLRGPLREWASDLLARERIVRDGYLHAAPIVEKWEQHQLGKHNWAGYLWDVLMFQSWLDELE
jgi:asparagine synthase (glutamine-hydrolysing)